MSEIIGAVIGAIAVIGIPLFAWFSQRMTREGRLMLRVQRLGTVYALMPDSAEKTIFETHFTGVIDSLNTWLEPGNTKRRQIVLLVSVGTYVLGVVAAFFLIPTYDTEHMPWIPSVAGVVIGALISAVSFSVAYGLEWKARQEEARQARIREAAIAKERMEAFARAELP